MKAIVLLSGGLDSTVALKLMVDQGIEVTALHFSSPFCRCDGKKGCGGNARKASDFSGAKLRSIFLGDEYLEMVNNPKHGRGKNLNPCIDCRILKFSSAKRIMKEEGASFIVTGEVLGQRPMSQRRDAMELIEQESGLKGLIVRPLSAKALMPSIPEREGWVDRNKFLAFTGRTRKPQIKLAAELGIKDYPCPAGGCLLTDSIFAKKLKDIIDNGELNAKNVGLLRYGRHFRLDDNTKVILGRNGDENKELRALQAEDDLLLRVRRGVGPDAILRGDTGEENVNKAASLVVSYSRDENKKNVEVAVWKTLKDRAICIASSLPRKETEKIKV